MKEYGFAENADYMSFSEISEKPKKGGRPSTDHQLTIEMAKEICMIQRSEKVSNAVGYKITVSLVTETVII